MSFSFHTLRSSGIPAVGAYATTSLDFNSGTYFCIDGKIAGLPSITVIPIVPFAV